MEVEQKSLNDSFSNEQPKVNTTVNTIRKLLLANDLVKLKEELLRNGENLKSTVTSVHLESFLSLVNSLECFEALFDSGVISNNLKLRENIHILQFFISLINYKPFITQVVFFLLEKGADPNEDIESRNKSIFMNYVSDVNHKEEIIDKMLSTSKIDLTSRDAKTGSSVLHILARMEDNELNQKLIRKFLKEGLNVDIRDYEGKNALAEAIAFSRTEIVKILLENGSNPRLKDKFGYSSLKRAQIAPAHIKQLLIH